MLIAREKRNENIAEYILYMWQVEDVIRACNFNITLIEQRIISQFTGSSKAIGEAREWYADLILSMHEEKIKESGHLRMVMDLVDELQKLHYHLVHIKKDTDYLEQYYLAVPNIRDIEKRMNGKTSSEVETCLSAIYALLLLRLQKKEVSKETLDAMKTFSNLLAFLSDHFKKLEEINKRK
jgi:hypothetical protein